MNARSTSLAAARGGVATPRRTGVRGPGSLEGASGAEATGEAVGEAGAEADSRAVAKAARAKQRPGGARGVVLRTR